MFRSKGAGREPQHRKDLWERWPTRIAVICAAFALLSVAFYAQTYEDPGSSTWHDKASTLLHDVGFHRAFDHHAPK